ncbi:GNAT family N-acetyltransferase [Cellulosimicrobium funkei]
MKDDNPIATWPMEHRYREVHRVLGLLNPNKSYCSPGDIPDIVDELERLAREARESAAATLGPSLHWTGSLDQVDTDTWGPVVLQVDFDTGEHDLPEGSRHEDEWDGSSLHLAAIAYRRECGWDFTPGKTGVWLLSVHPFRGQSTTTWATWGGVLTGFVILYDEGEGYQTLGHVWTAQHWRRRGIATKLVQLAKERFPVRQVDGLSQDGDRFLRAAASDLLEP